MMGLFSTAQVSRTIIIPAEIILAVSVLTSSFIIYDCLFLALHSGEGLAPEVLETLVKVAPSDDEKRKFLKFDGKLTDLGPADRFFHALLEVPNAWSRLNAMLYQSQYKEEVRSVQDALHVLRVS